MTNLVAKRTLSVLGQVTPEIADELWQAKRALFFKPLSGHGSRAVYRSEKLTKGVRAVIVKGGDFAPRMIELDGQRVPRKVDIRQYTYKARPLLVAARVYQGQATNIRTPGGGFTPVLVT